MLLCEMVRKINEEELLAKDDATYWDNGTCDWTTMKSITITLSEPKNILVKCIVKFYVGTSSHYVDGNGRISLGNTPLISTGHIYWAPGSADTKEVPLECFLRLDAGTHTFNFEIAIQRVYAAGDNNNRVGIGQIKIGTFDFSQNRERKGTNNTKSEVINPLLAGVVWTRPIV